MGVIKQLALDLIPQNAYSSTTSLQGVINYYTPSITENIIDQNAKLKTHAELYYYAQMANRFTEGGQVMRGWKVPYATQGGHYQGTWINQKNLTKLHKYYRDPSRNKPGGRTYNMSVGVNISLTEFQLKGTQTT